MVTAMICDGVFMICIICIILRVLMNFCFNRCFLLTLLPSSGKLLFVSSGLARLYFASTWGPRDHV